MSLPLLLALSTGALAQAPFQAPEVTVSPWWTQAEPCPAGTSIQGAPWPQGGAVWCALDDSVGERHGPFTAWFSTGHVSRDGRYDRDRAVGTWLSVSDIDGARCVEERALGVPRSGWMRTLVTLQQQGRGSVRHGTRTCWGGETFPSTTQWARDAQTGVAHTWFPSGAAYRSVTVDKRGPHDRWYESGQAAIQVRRRPLGSIERTWYADGGPRTVQIHRREGRRPVRETAWYEDGTVRMEGRASGRGSEVVQFGPDGQIASVETCVTGDGCETARGPAALQ